MTPSTDDDHVRPLPRWMPARLANSRTRLVVLAVSSIVAILAGVLLALASVNTSKVMVDWPKSDADARSTVLLLTNQTPHTLDLSFTGAAASAAADTDDHVLFSTIDPKAADAGTDGLELTANGASVTVASGGRTATVAVASADQRFELTSSVSGLTLTAGGQNVVTWPSVLPPQVDALVTSVQGFDASTLSARLQLVDDSNNTPTGLKVGIMVVLWLAVIVALLTLWLDDRMRPSRGAVTGRAATRDAWFRRAVCVTDIIVAAALVLWAFIGPMTDDDGYYAVMSYNNGVAGYVGNYYQMFNAPFSPFTWFWQFLDLWQHIGGRSPVWLRLPAVIAAVVAWYLVRRMLDAVLADASPWRRRLSRLSLAVVFVLWWSTYAIGSRPEGIGSLATVAAIALLVPAIRTRRLLPAAAAVLVSGLAFAMHPTGAVAFAPLIIGIAALWTVARERGSVGAAVVRTVAVLSTGAIVLFAAFADASLNDMLTAQTRFAAVEVPLNFTDEFDRYQHLLAFDPMGSYSKRSVVLVSLVLLVWFLALWMAARFKRVRVPAYFTYAGWSLGLGYLLLWITPSKWTHHFGALSSIGALFVVLMLFYAPTLVRRLVPAGRGIPVWLAPAAALSLVAPILVSLKGPNWWAYAWGQGIRDFGAKPELGLKLESPVLWGGIIVVIAVVVTIVLARKHSWRSPGSLFSATALGMAFFTLVGGYLYGTFGAAAVNTLGTFSVGAANLKDPGGGRCLIDNAVTVWDAAKGSTLPLSEPAKPLTPGGAFTDAHAWPASLALPHVDGPTTYVTNAHSPAAAGVGVYTSGWYSVPALSADDRIAVLAAGSLAAGSPVTISAQLGVRQNGQVSVTSTVPVQDTANRPGWRTLLPGLPGLTGGSGQLVRIVVTSTSTAPGAWAAVSEPRLTHGVSMESLAAPNASTAIAWQMSFWFPCQRPMSIADGVIEPPVYATSWGSGPVDNIWSIPRGGALAGVQRLAAISVPTSSMVGRGSNWGRIYEFDYPYALGAYRMTTSRVTTMGWKAPFGLVSQLVATPTPTP